MIDFNSLFPAQVCAFAKLRFDPGREWLEAFSEAVAGQVGTGSLLELDHFHIEWAWRELNDQYKEQRRQRLAAEQGTTSAALAPR